MCGVIGVIGSPSSALEVYQGLMTIQHRGQDAAGILSYDFDEERFHLTKNLGLVSEIFSEDKLDNLVGPMSLGHTRYSTVGRGEISDVQPMRVGHPLGMGIVHNGNVLNYYRVRRELQEEHSCHFLTHNDVEIIQNVLLDSLNQKKALNFDSLVKATEEVFDRVIGGYVAIGCVAQQGFFALRDPKGIRPLILGERKLSAQEIKENGDYYTGKKAYCLASESAVFFKLGFEIVRDVKPGEVLFIDRKGKITSKQIRIEEARPCMFEWIYFATPESTIDEKSVYTSRMNCGVGLSKEVKRLLKEKKIKPDMVITVPETSRLAALSLAEEVNIPYREVLMKNRYIHRSFIQKNDTQRKRVVNMKLSPVPTVVKGKNILVVDDSIVRGTTSKRLIDLLKQAGANEVYMASTCPPLKYPCYYGIDFPDSEELIAYNRSEAEIAKMIGADRVIYMDIESLKEAIGQQNICKACLDGEYPTDISDAKEFKENRGKDRYRLRE